MYQSIFSYSITKSYPYRWFTWVVVLGGIVATILFTFLSLATTGYDPSLQYVANLNETESPPYPRWFQKKPWSWISKVPSTCQAQTFLVGSQFYTSNLALPYTITGLYKQTPKQQRPRSTFAYRNDYLHDCHVNEIQIKPYDVNLWGYPARASINCTVYDDVEPVTMTLDLSTSLNNNRGLDSSMAGQRILFATDPHTQTSLFWGRNLMSLYVRMSGAPRDVQGFWAFGTYAQLHDPFLPRPKDPKAVQMAGYVTIPNLPYPRVSLGFISVISPDLWSSVFGNDMTKGRMMSTRYYNGTTKFVDPSRPDIVTAIIFDGLAKCLYSIILTDLGQPTSSNALAFPERIIDFANQTVQIGSTPITHQDREWTVRWQMVLNDLPVLSNTHWAEQLASGPDSLYDWAGSGVPSVKPAVISTQYACQIPKLKSTGSLVISVIIADFVLLQVLWTIFNFTAAFFVERRCPDAKYCSGCANRTVLESNVNVVEIKSDVSMDEKGQQRFVSPSHLFIKSGKITNVDIGRVNAESKAASPHPSQEV